jgi:hypothetical protein
VLTLGVVLRPVLAAGSSGTVPGTPYGRLAQLGERCVRNAEVRSSILLPSTNLSQSTPAGAAPAQHGALTRIATTSTRREGGSRGSLPSDAEWTRLAAPARSRPAADPASDLWLGDRHDEPPFELSAQRVPILPV